MSDIECWFSLSAWMVKSTVGFLVFIIVVCSFLVCSTVPTRHVNDQTFLLSRYLTWQYRVVNGMYDAGLSRSLDHKSDTLTTTLPSHPSSSCSSCDIMDSVSHQTVLMLVAEIGHCCTGDRKRQWRPDPAINWDLHCCCEVSDSVS